jgi:diacylglycerol kinase family enzyme
MYAYIYDIFTNESKYEKSLQKIESLLSEFGILGKLYKLNVLKNLEQIINDVIEGGIKNIIVVGNDQTISRVANLIIGKDIVLGVIPLGDPNLLSAHLGIKSIEEAVKIAAARKIIKLDVGKINGQFFLMSAESYDKNIVCDLREYNINPLRNNKSVGIYNFNVDNLSFSANPSDGIMETVFQPHEATLWQKIWHIKSTSHQTNLSVFPVKKITLKHFKKPVEVILDRQKILKTPLTIEVLQQKLMIIVGRKKKF